MLTIPLLFPRDDTSKAALTIVDAVSSRSAYSAQSHVYVMLQSKFLEFSALTAVAAKCRLFLVRVVET